MNRFILAIVFVWAAAFAVAQISTVKCTGPLVKIDLDSDTYAKRASGFDSGTLIVIDSARSIFNIGHIDVFLIDGAGKIIRGLNSSRIDSIADLHAFQRHGPGAKVKRSETVLDSILCMRTVYHIRGLREVEGEDLIRIEFSIIVEDVDIRYGYAFENAFFTVDVDYDLNLCKSALMEDPSVLEHALSLVNGTSSSTELVQKFDRSNDLDSNQHLFARYIMENDRWVFKGPVTNLKQNVGVNFFAHFPAGINHPLGRLYSNGKKAVVFNEKKESVLEWEVNDWHETIIKKLIPHREEYLAISFSFVEGVRSTDEQYYVVEYRDSKLKPRVKIAKYIMNRFLVNDISLEGSHLHVLLFDKRSKNHLIHTLNLEAGCENEIYQ